MATLAFGKAGSFLSKVSRRLSKRPDCLSSCRFYYDYSREPFHPIAGRKQEWKTADEAVSVIASNNVVFVHGCAATPSVLLEAMARHGQKAQLKDVQTIHIHIEGPVPHMKPEFKGIFRDNSLFIGANCRPAVNEGLADSTPIFLGDIPYLFIRNIVKVDVALLQVTPPDEHGYCSLGPSVDTARAAAQNAKVLIAQVNKNQPRTFGDSMIHVSHFDALVEVNTPLPSPKKNAGSEVEATIGKLIADNLVDDGATLQMGIGSMPDAVLAGLKNHRDLGVHSEMFSDGLIPLINCGAMTNAKKKLQTGKIVSGFAYGSQEMYAFMHNNPLIVMCELTFTNAESFICQNPKVTAINSCIEVDIMGQVVSDSIGTRLFSGFGGQVDFLRGAALSSDGLGKPILAMPSLTPKGISKIVPFIKEGAGVVTTRAHAHYIVTEHGIAFLFGKTYRQRAHALINIAHPDHREELEKAAFKRLKCMPSA